MATAVKKSDLLSTEVLDKVFPVAMQVGSHKVEIRSYKETAGHDDSLPYQAKVCADGKEIAVCYNDGWGGMTSVQATKKDAYPVLNEIEKYIRDHKEEFSMGEYMGIELHHTDLSSICDTLAVNCARRQDALKYADKALVVYNTKEATLSRVTFTSNKRDKLADLAGGHVFRKIWFDTIDKYKKDGYEILSVEDIFKIFRKTA